MNKANTNIFLLFLMALQLSCATAPDKEDLNYVRIPIEYRKASSIKLSEFVESVDLIPLETTEDNPLKLNAVLIYQTAWNSRWKREDRTALHTKS